MTEQSIGKLASALAEAQKAFKPIKKDKTAKVKGTSKGGRDFEYEYHYADLANVIDCVREALADNKIAYSQPTRITERGLVLVTILMHESGETSEGYLPIPSGLSPQELGSHLTYMRRYGLCSAVGVSAEEDDDGKAAQNAKPAAKAENAASKAASNQKPAKTETEAKFFIIDGEGTEHGIMTGPLYLKAITHYFKEAVNKAGFWESNEAKFKEYHAQEVKVGGKAADADFSEVRDIIVGVISGSSNMAAA